MLAYVRIFGRDTSLAVGWGISGLVGEEVAVGEYCRLANDLAVDIAVAGCDEKGFSDVGEFPLRCELDEPSASPMLDSVRERASMRLATPCLVGLGVRDAECTGDDGPKSCDNAFVLLGVVERESGVEVNVLLRLVGVIGLWGTDALAFDDV